jgi:hypothetical protein
MTPTIQIDLKSKEGKLLAEYLKSVPYGTIEKNQKSIYNPEFIKKINRAKKQEGIIIDTNDVWGSLGLK